LSPSTSYEVNLHIRFTFYGARGDSVVASMWGEGTDMGDKATNKAMTMALKGVLAQSFAVSTQESYDTDGKTNEETTRRGRSNGQTRPAQTRTPEILRAKSWAELAERLAALGVPAEDSAEWLRQAKDALETAADSGTLFQCANEFLSLLTRNGEVFFDGDPRPLLRRLVVEAFKLPAEVDRLPAEIDGPAWRIGPGEVIRPTREEWTLAQTEAARPSLDEDIPF